MIYVLAITTAKPGMRDAALKEFRANMPAILAEPGCLEYGPATDAKDFGGLQTVLGDDAFVSIEKWQTPEALKAHAAGAHFAAYAAKTKDLIATLIVHVLSPT